VSDAEVHVRLKRTGALLRGTTCGKTGNDRSAFGAKVAFCEPEDGRSRFVNRFG
jgi:hypothetical protein